VIICSKAKSIIIIIIIRAVQYNMKMLKLNHILVHPVLAAYNLSEPTIILTCTFKQQHQDAHILGKGAGIKEDQRPNPKNYHNQTIYKLEYVYATHYS
jgi:hypothetical protein